MLTDEEVEQADNFDRLVRKRLAELGINELTDASAAVVRAMRVQGLAADRP